MRYPGSEKLEIIHPVEQSHLPVRRTLAMLGILPMTFYRCSLLSCATPKMGRPGLRKSSFEMTQSHFLIAFYR